MDNKKKLLVLDLNGLLVDLIFPPPKNCNADACIHGEAVYVRPFCLDFLKFCLDRFDVGVWSSRSKQRINEILDVIMKDMKQKLLFVLDYSECTIAPYMTPEGKSRTKCFKDLRRIWNKESPDFPWEKGYYNESNTLLLDDSPHKAFINPAHTAVFPSSYCFQETNDDSLGPEGDLRIYLKGLAAAHDVREYVVKHPFGQKAITPGSDSWGFYQKLISKLPPSSIST